MKNIKVICDSCDKDLTSTSSCEDFRIVLASEPIPSRGGIVTLMAVYPPIDSAKHFCGIECLSKWCKLNI